MLAIDAIRSFSGLPIIAQLTYSEEGTTFGDLRPAGAAAQLKNKNVQVIGANCTLGPQALLPILQELAGVEDVRVSGMPNAGFPKREGDRIVYPQSSPEYFALFAREAAAMGVRILGGCCGTTPAHIQAMAEAVKSLTPVAATTIAHVKPLSKTPAVVANASRRANSGANCRTKNSPLRGNRSAEGNFARPRVRAGRQNHGLRHVDAIDINSGAMARVGMDALVVAGALEARGVETVPHLTTRDYNIIGLQAMLLGAWTVGGVRNVLAITGDPPSVGDYPETSGVYEVDSVGLVKVLHRLNQGTDWAGKTLGGATNFAIGVAVNPVADDLDGEIESVSRQNRSWRALCHDAAALRSRALVCVRKKAGRQAGDPGADRGLAAQQLQAGPAAEQ